VLQDAVGWIGLYWVEVGGWVAVAIEGVEVCGHMDGKVNDGMLKGGGVVCGGIERIRGSRLGELRVFERWLFGKGWNGVGETL
jgi:hypothetical protein